MSQSHKIIFYKTSSFYISLIALIFSVISLLISYFSSPISDYTKPEIVFWSGAYVGKKINELTTEVGMEGAIINKSDFGAENVIVKISTPIDESSRFVSSGLPFNLISHNKVSIVIQYPLFPPHHEQGITVWSTTENRWIMPGSNWHYTPSISSVTLQNGIARELKLNLYKPNKNANQKGNRTE
jgi:hypothetical protein